MWLLKKLNDGTVKYLISEHKTYTVGRKNCDIILEEDSSVSRKHCTIHVAKKNDCPFDVNTLTGIWIVDEESKYGTYLKSKDEWIKLSPQQNHRLINGSVIRFGLMGNLWSLEYRPILACPSGIQTEHKRQIDNALKAIDGLLRNAWCKECSLVIVNQVTLTVKVVLALINGVPIVTQNYIEKLVENVKSQSPFPNHEDFRPDIKESVLDATLVSLDAKKTRKDLFRGKKFVVPTKSQLEALKEVILSAGGEIELFSNVSDWKQFAKDNVIMIQIPLNNKQLGELEKSFEQVLSNLKNKCGRRAIPESEIALAVAYSSTEKYCNAKSTCFNLKRTIKEHDPGVLLVEETPDMSQISDIPEACISSCSSTTDSVRDPLRAEFQIKINERKRIHSPEQPNYEHQLKRARSNPALEEREEAPRLNPPSSERESLVKNCDKNEVKQTSSTKNNAKNSFITSYFKRQLKPGEDSAQGQLGDKKSDTPKRKLSSEKDVAEENYGRKKMRFPAEEIHHQQQQHHHHHQITQECNETINYQTLSPQCRLEQRNDFEEEDNLADFIERDEKEFVNVTVESLNDTIFSLTLVPSTYVKEDGSLSEPPRMPVNVKHFRSKKGNTTVIVTPLEEEELSSGDWIEPHPPHFGIAGASDDW